MSFWLFQSAGLIAIGFSSAGVQAVPIAEEYGARIDLWAKLHEQAVKVGEDSVLLLRLHNGHLAAFELDGQTPVELEPEILYQFRSVFPSEAYDPPVNEKDWEMRVKHESFGNSVEHACSVGADNKLEKASTCFAVDPLCPVLKENHLEKAILEAWTMLRGKPKRRSVNVGGLYGGKFGEGDDAPDDPTVELVRATRGMKVLCWDCGDVRSVTRAKGYAHQFEKWHVTSFDPTFQPVEVPFEFRSVDLLRLDFVSDGQSCQLLRRLLVAGMKPRMVAMLVMSQIPPPFKYTPLPLSKDPNRGFESKRTSEIFFSCSLAAAQEVLSPYDMFLVRLTGPYALFVQRDEWPTELPISDLQCYREALVWGNRALPIEFIREWLFSNTSATLHRMWNNLTVLHGNSPFTLAL